MKLSLLIARSIISSTLLVLVIFLGLILFVSLLGEVQQINNTGYGFPQALSYVINSTPLAIYNIFPTIMLIGTLMGLGTLATHNELTIMRTSGMSLTRISAVVMVSAIMMIFFATLIGEGVAPKLSATASYHQNLARNNTQSIVTATGVWIKNDTVFYHIDTVNSAEKLTGILRFEFNSQHRLVNASQASSANLTNAGWVFSNVKMTSIFDDHVTASNYPSINWPLQFNLKQFTEIDPKNLNLEQLQQQIKLDTQSGNNTSALRLNFWSRLFQPLMTLVMVFIAIPFIFGPLRSVSIGLRLLSGITVGLVFYIMNQFVASFGLAYQIQPIIASISLPALFFVFGLFLFWWKK
jgi:lipopolysaccharide export system permease protein